MFDSLSASIACTNLWLNHGTEGNPLSTSDSTSTATTTTTTTTASTSSTTSTLGPISNAVARRVADLDQRWIIPLEELAIDESAKLGSGALGEVKRAVWNGSLKVAAKRLFFMATDPVALQAMGGALDTAAKEGVLRDFLKECSINSSIRHPNVVMFLGVGVDRALNEPRYLVLELMERGSLHDEIYPGGEVPRRGEPMAFARIASLLLDIARALVYLHSRRPPVLHLDLKPKNVLIDRGGTAKVGDLGEAHVIQSTRQATKSAFGVGTPVYMAPELAVQGLHRGPSADMFSFGVMACEMSSGRSPDPGPQIKQVPGGGLQVIPERERREADMAAIQHAEIRELVDHLIVNEPDQRWSAPQVQSFLEDQLQRIPSEPATPPSK